MTFLKATKPKEKAQNTKARRPKSFSSLWSTRCCQVSSFEGAAEPPRVALRKPLVQPPSVIPSQPPRSISSEPATKSRPSSSSAAQHESPPAPRVKAAEPHTPHSPQEVAHTSDPCKCGPPLASFSC